jgi:phage shock protein PspC (stress-responsive transcriptional regulator)
MKKLTRSKDDRVLFGVCGGIGQYFDVDPVIIRIIFIILLFTGGTGFLAYIIAIFIIPEGRNTNQKINYDKNENNEDFNKKYNKDELYIPEKNKDSKDSVETTGMIIGIVLIFFGTLFLMKNFSFMDETYYYIINGIKKFFWPTLLIGLGLLVIYKNK